MVLELVTLRDDYILTNVPLQPPQPSLIEVYTIDP